MTILQFQQSRVNDAERQFGCSVRLLYISNGQIGWASLQSNVAFDERQLCWKTAWSSVSMSRHLPNQWSEQCIDVAPPTQPMIPNKPAVSMMEPRRQIKRASTTRREETISATRQSVPWTRDLIPVGGRDGSALCCGIEEMFPQYGWRW